MSEDAFFVRIVGRTGEFVRTVQKVFTQAEAKIYADGHNGCSGQARAVVCRAPEAFSERKGECIRKLPVEIVRRGIVQQVFHLDDPRGEFISKLNRVLRSSDPDLFARMPEATEGGAA